MASTTLFAPQVRAVQPAFEYISDTNIKIYFSLSGGNTLESFTHIRYRIINPNTGSSILKESMFDSDKGIYYHSIENNINNIKQNENKITEFYFEINKNTLNDLIPEQYYQAQIWLYNQTMTEEGQAIINSSPVSQITLLRPFYGINGVQIEGLENENNSLFYFDTLSGEFLHNSNSVEYIKEYYYTITKQGATEGVSSPVIINNLGFKFNTKLNYIFDYDQSYTLTIYYTTINDYTNSVSRVFTLTKFSIEDYWETQDPEMTMEVEYNSAIAAIDVNLCFSIDNFSTEKIILQRTDENSSFIKWEDIAVYGLTSAAINESGLAYFNWQDIVIESDMLYKYRALVYENKQAVYPKLITKEYDCESKTFENIYISNEDYLMVLRFNPNITNFKWVTQEAITNTLGGRYPIVRTSGETHYKQFNLSGTLYFPALTDSNIIDSRGRIFDYDDADSCNLYLSQLNFYNLLSTKSKVLIERKLRDEAMNFLVNKKPKIFRSGEEGNMIIHLSNIVFTPNKTLDRKIIDFSATVTELCEANLENFKKYNFKTSKCDIYKYFYNLNVYSVEENTAYINAKNLSVENHSVKLDAIKVGELL